MALADWGRSPIDLRVAGVAKALGDMVYVPREEMDALTPRWRRRIQFELERQAVRPYLVWKQYVVQGYEGCTWRKTEVLHAQRRASRVVMQMRQMKTGKVMYRFTVLAGAQNECLQLWDVPEESIAAVGSQVDLLVYVRSYVDRSKMAQYSLGLGTTDDEF